MRFSPSLRHMRHYLLFALAYGFVLLTLAFGRSEFASRGPGDPSDATPVIRHFQLSTRWQPDERP